MESHTRSIAKAVSYRVLGSITTAIVFFAFSHDWRISAGAGLIDSVLKIGLYFVHERIWNHVNFGRERPPEYEI
jgi:adenylylsulfate kinase